MEILLFAQAAEQASKGLKAIVFYARSSSA